MTQSSLLSKDSIRPVFLALLITSYHHDAAVQRTIDMVRSSRFFNPDSPEYGHLFLYVIDNGRTLGEKDEWNFRIIPNRNTGGSEGFGRGIEEVRKNADSYPVTHIIFMDDDAEADVETLYRTYDVLQHLKEEYRDSVISGRMYDARRRDIQYTACEIWNGGNIRHVEFNRPDADIPADEISADEGEYTGWWYAVYPWPFVKDNDPLPFFLHCDDVEYGLRFNRKVPLSRRTEHPIIVKGIQVWHEIAADRPSKLINEYYDRRNPLIVNALYGLLPDMESLYADWFESITKAHVEDDYQTEYYRIRAFYDFLRGRKWLYHVDSEKNHEALRKHKPRRYENAILWRLTRRVFRKRQKSGWNWEES